MFNPLKQLGDLRQLQKQAAEIQKQLADEEIVVRHRQVEVKVSGDQKIKEINFLVESPSPEAVKKAVNEALNRAQKLAAQKLMGRVI